MWLTLCVNSLLSAEEKRLHELMKPHGVSESTMSQLRYTERLIEAALLTLNPDRISSMHLPQGQGEALMAAVVDLKHEVAVR